MRIAVIGAGSIGRRHFDNLVSLGIDAVQVPHRSYRPDVLDDCDAAVIATATDVRTGPIADAADRDLPMYIEKPLAFRAADLATIERLTAKVADRTMLGLMMRYHPAFRALADMDMSTAVRFSLDIGHDVTQWRQNWKFSESYAAKADGGGVLLDLCHEIDMASVLFPDLMLKSVTSVGHPNYDGVDFSSRLTVQTGAGAEGSIGMDYLTPQLHRRTIVYAVDAIYDFDFAAQRYEVKNTTGARLIDLPLERNEMFVGITRDWITLLEGREITNRLLPRIDRVTTSTALTAAAWEARKFVGHITKEIP
ncbi:MAG: gfo/Idh/MocA family oxidoreductase [Marivivens sp.]|jgi:predicted dehydrogenase|nr:gfo/Idh/MocA family oxidoreductase [Marivivens sp.]